MAGMSPPGPLRCGSTTWRVKPAATAASKALPPRSRTAMPALLASQWVEATMPKVPASSGRVVGRSTPRLTAEERGDDDDSPPTLPAHLRQGQEGEPDGRVQVAGHGRFQLGDPGVSPTAAGAEAEVVHQNLDLAAARLHRLCAARLGGEVGGDRD